MPPTFAIAVVNYNGMRHLDRCLRSVGKQLGKTDKLFLVDNGSTDGSAKHVRKQHSYVEVISLRSNVGFAAACNRAVESASQDFVILLNNDIEVAPGWLASLKHAARDHPNDVAAWGSALYMFENRRIINHVGGVFTPIGGGVDLGMGTIAVSSGKNPKPVAFVSGASMMVPREMFLNLGGFDDDYFVYFEDVDYCWRAWVLGYTVLHVPGSRVFHRLGGTIGRLWSPYRVYLGERNRLQTLLKNAAWPSILVGLIVSLAFTWLRLMFFFISGERQALTSMFHGQVWVLRSLRQIFVKRRRVQSRRVRSDFDLRRRGLVLPLASALREFVRLRKWLKSTPSRKTTCLAKCSKGNYTDGASWPAISQSRCE